MSSLSVNSMTNELSEELKYTYKWTLSADIEDIIKSPVFVTKNNTKWYLKVDLRYVKHQKSSIGFYLILVESSESEVDIKFNLFRLVDDFLENKQKLITILMKESKMKKNDVLGQMLDYDESLKSKFCHSFKIYWEIIDRKSVPTLTDKVGTNLIQDLKSMTSKDNEEYCDLTIVVKGREFMAHKCVLSVRSQVFSRMFGSDMKEKIENRVELNDVEVEVFEELMSFIYTGSAPKIETYAEELLVCADCYGLADLKNICEEILCKNFTIESSIDFLLFSNKYNANYLKERLIEFIANNYLEIEVKCNNSLNDLFKKESKIMESIVHKMAELNVKEPGLPPEVLYLQGVEPSQTSRSSR